MGKYEIIYIFFDYWEMFENVYSLQESRKG